MNKLEGLERARFAAMRGTFAENEKYCSKQDSLTHFGVPFIGKGGRTDRNNIFAMVKAGMNDLEIMEADFAGFCRFDRGIQRYRSCITPVRTTPMELLLFYGEPGTGKTKFATAQLSMIGKPYRMPVSDKLWTTPGFQVKAKHIIIDEFKSNIGLTNLLQILDDEPVEVEYKGGFQWWMPDIIIITTNRSPWNWYKYETRDMEREALFRRFTGCFRFDKNQDRVPKPYEIDINNPADFHYAEPVIANQGIMSLNNGMLI